MGTLLFHSQFRWPTYWPTRSTGPSLVAPRRKTSEGEARTDTPCDALDGRRCIVIAAVPGR